MAPRAAPARPPARPPGSREALELRDGDPARYLGKGVQKAVGQCQRGRCAMRCSDGMRRISARIDRAHAGGSTARRTRTRLGANAMLAVSLATAKAAAASAGKPLYAHIAGLYGRGSLSMPVPMMNILNGGEHADNNVDIQEFMIQPVAAGSFAEALRCGAEIFHHLKKVLVGRGLSHRRGRRGRLCPGPALQRGRGSGGHRRGRGEAAGYSLGDDVTLALDCAASEFYRDGTLRACRRWPRLRQRRLSEYLASSPRRTRSCPSKTASMSRLGWLEAAHRAPG
jgi:enolase